MMSLRLLISLKQDAVIWCSCKNCMCPTTPWLFLTWAMLTTRTLRNGAQEESDGLPDKKSLAYVEVLEQCSLSEVSINRGVLKDEKVRLGRPSNERVTPLIGARRIAFHDELKNRDFLFITNDFESSPEAIADLYKKRWQIELLFKRIKQRYPLKYFLGDNANAIQVQVWCALICDLLVKIIQNMVNRTLKKKWAYSSIFGMIKHHLMTYINLFEFLKNPDRALINYKPPPSQLSLF
jgi:IS4 transposase